MPNKGKLLLLGGDMRMFTVARRLYADGWNIHMTGFSEHCRTSQVSSVVDSLCCSGCDVGIDIPEDFPKQIRITEKTASDFFADIFAVILPLPFSQDGTTVYMPFTKEPLTLTELSVMLSQSAVKRIGGGRLSEGFTKRISGIDSILDYYAREEFSVANAVPTAEGAIAIAMEELPITIADSSSLVIGYGRIGRVLSKKLSLLGSHVTVSARKAADFAWIHAEGYESADTECLYEYFGTDTPDVIFNTVPHCVLNHGVLAAVKRGTPIIDLASKPGGIDMVSASEMRHKVIWALSLPRRYAPVTSGNIIADTLLCWLTEEYRKENPT